MKEAVEFFNNFKAGLLGGLYTGALAKVESYDPVGKVDIVVLPDGDLVKSVPVATLQGGGFFIRSPLAKDDLVVVLFTKDAIDGIMHETDELSTRSHDLNDAIVLGGINLFSDPLPSDEPDALVIGKKDMTSRITMTPDGNVTVEASGKIYLGDGATEGVPLGAQLKSWLDSHTHTAPADGGATSGPTSASPSPSTGVYVK